MSLIAKHCNIQMLRLWGVPLPPWLPSLSSLDPPNKYLEPALSQGGPSTLATPTENFRDFALSPDYLLYVWSGE